MKTRINTRTAPHLSRLDTHPALSIPYRAMIGLILTTLFLTVTGLAIRAAEGPTKADAPRTGSLSNVGVPQFEKLRGDKNNVVLDVRTAKEFAAGHMPGAT